MDDPRERLKRLQDELAANGLYSMLWNDGDTWHFIAGTDPHWVDRQWHQIATDGTVGNWVPAIPVVIREMRDDAVMASGGEVAITDGGACTDEVHRLRAMLQDCLKFAHRVWIDAPRGSDLEREARVHEIDISSRIHEMVTGQR